jgi:hypothetical protein
MLALEPQNMHNMLAALNPMANGFTRARRAATAVGFIVYCGIISVTDPLWMWMGRNTTFQLRTITTTVTFALICSAVCLYPPQRGENPAMPTHSSIQRRGVASLSTKALTVGEAGKGHWPIRR